jgi:hypothetical protein
MIPEDFKDILYPKTAADKRPLQHLFVFDPETTQVHLDHAKGNDFPIHEHLAEHVTHPDRVEGYAIAVKNGWRILDAEMREVDPFVKEQVKKALRGEHPAPPLPSIRYHGSPINHVSQSIEQFDQAAATEDEHDYWPAGQVSERVDDDGQASPKS